LSNAKCKLLASGKTPPKTNLPLEKLNFLVTFENTDRSRCQCCSTITFLSHYNLPSCFRGWTYYPDYYAGLMQTKAKFAHLKGRFTGGCRVVGWRFVLQDKITLVA